MRKLILVLTVATLLTGSAKGVGAQQKPTYPCAFEQKVNGRWTGKLSLREANRLRAKSVRVGQRIAVRLNDVTQADVPFMIRCVFARLGLDWRKAQAVAECESHSDPEAFNPGGYGGVFQHHIGSWAARAALWGHKGAHWSDGYSNVHVSAQMVKVQGWQGWACA